MVEDYNLEVSRLRLDAAFKALENLVERKIREKVEEGSKFLELEGKIITLTSQNSQIQTKLQEIAVTIDKSIAKITALVEEENANS
jgi:hypothetical protein